MSAISFTSHKQGVQDLIAALPAPAKPASDRSGGADVGGEAKPGFSELLRDSSASQQTTPRSESGDSAAGSPRPETPEQTSPEHDSVEQEGLAGDSSDAAEQDASIDHQSDTISEQDASGGGETSSGEAQSDVEVQASTLAASTQLNVVDALATDQPKAQNQASVVTQVASAVMDENAVAGKTDDQASLASTNVLANGVVPISLQPTAHGQAVQAEATAVVQPVLQHGDLSQGHPGDTASDQNAAAGAMRSDATSSTSGSTTATTAFALPDQANGDAKLSIAPTTATSSSDTARQVQAQSALQAGDNDALNTARLTRGLANAVQQRGGTVTLRLTPPEMGTVRIEMQLAGTNVSARFHAESASAQTLLTTQLAQLRSALESKGMSVDRLTVQPLAVATASSSASQSQSQSQGQGDAQQQGASHQGANDGRSRGQYSGDGSGQQLPGQPSGDGDDRSGPRGFFDQLSDVSGEQAA